MSLSIPFPFGWLQNKKAARVEVNISLAFLHWVGIALHPWPFVSDIAIFVLKRDVKLELINFGNKWCRLLLVRCHFCHRSIIIKALKWTGLIFSRSIGWLPGQQNPLRWCWYLDDNKPTINCRLFLLIIFEYRKIKGARLWQRYLAVGVNKGNDRLNLSTELSHVSSNKCAKQFIGSIAYFLQNNLPCINGDFQVYRYWTENMWLPIWCQQSPCVNIFIFIHHNGREKYTCSNTKTIKSERKIEANNLTKQIKTCNVWQTMLVLWIAWL